MAPEYLHISASMSGLGVERPFSTTLLRIPIWNRKTFAGDVTSYFNHATTSMSETYDQLGRDFVYKLHTSRASNGSKWVTDLSFKATLKNSNGGKDQSIASSSITLARGHLETTGYSREILREFLSKLKNEQNDLKLDLAFTVSVTYTAEPVNSNMEYTITKIALTGAFSFLQPPHR